MLNTQILYEDKFVKITDSDLTLFWYYFPFGQNKTIKLTDIREVKLEELKLSNGKYRLWGINLNLNWFPLDNLRFRKTHFINLDIRSKIKPSFTSDNINEIYDLLKEKISQNTSKN